MTYQVLARKWRPRNFQQMVGQMHVLKALINALDSQRLHHAYLFTGTRGVGKTSIARILAKSLNCEVGISATPCGICSNCVEIDQGRFMDLIEVDAASRTKVEDTRELLDNVQYTPTRGRFKIYLIDEVHMLSGHSFNALLKTLEEPPPHVKFLLATTDPQRLPITVLSRCLQFHLKNMPAEQIATHLAHILQEEHIAFEQDALAQLAQAANGSMRDALSLLDQAIGYGAGQVQTQDVITMLGITPAQNISMLVTALADHHASALMTAIAQLAEQAADFTQVLEGLLSLLHQIAVVQLVPDSFDNEELRTFATRFSKEEIQLYYQIALIGRRDLPLAPNPRTGFEMVLLRMLAFQPAAEDNIPADTKPLKKQVISDWPTILSKLKLTGVSQIIAANCTLQQMSEDHILLALDPTHSTMLNAKHEERIAAALHEYLGKTPSIKIQLGTQGAATPALIQKQQQEQQHQQALNTLENDPHIQAIVQTFSAKIQTDTIKTLSSPTPEPHHESE